GAGIPADGLQKFAWRKYSAAGSKVSSTVAQPSKIPQRLQRLSRLRVHRDRLRLEPAPGAQQFQADLGEEPTGADLFALGEVLALGGIAAAAVELGASAELEAEGVDELPVPLRDAHAVPPFVAQVREGGAVSSGLEKIGSGQ